jgi:hypothetical protein
LRETLRWPATPPGQQAFEKWLADHEGSVARLTTETPDEDYRLEQLPHAAGRSGRDLLERKLHQFYRESRFRAARVTGRVAGKRREDRCLFAALIDERVLTPWLEPLRKARVAIAGLFPVPLLLVDALRVLRPKMTDVLIVTQWADGIRQTYIRSSCPRMTRVTNLPPNESAGSIVLDEIRQTQAYLEGLGLAASDALPVLMLDADGALADVERHADSPALRIVRIPLASAARNLKLGARPLDRESLQLQLLARHRPRMNLAPPDLLAAFVRRRRARILAAASALISMAGATTCALQMNDALRTAETRESLTRQIAGSKSSSSLVEVKPMLLPKVIGLLSAVDGRGSATRMAELAYLAVSAGLDRQPQLSLVSLRWHADEKALASIPAGGPDPHAIVIARVNILASPEDFRLAEDLMQAFILTVRRQPAVRSADVTARPQGLGADETLRGQSSGSAGTSNPAPQFEATIYLPLHAAQR